jgi:hypothetical protein
MVVASASNTFCFELVEYPCTHFLSKSLLNCENEEETYTRAPEGEYEVVYEEPDLSGGVEGVDYWTVYGTEEVEVEE